MAGIAPVAIRDLQRAVRNGQAVDRAGCGRVAVVFGPQVVRALAALTQPERDEERPGPAKNRVTFHLTTTLARGRIRVFDLRLIKIEPKLAITNLIRLRSRPKMAVT